MKNIQKIKGTQDILPDISAKWQYIEKTVRTIMRRYGYNEIRTPMFEVTDLFARGIGQLTDIVSKEMYTFLDRSKKSITLRPEGTAPVMRAYLENNLGEARPVQKLYYISPMFRQENPQAGRLRQFHQFGVECIGPQAPEADVETIMVGLDIYRELGLKNFTVKINSVGDAESRIAYKAQLQEFLKPSFAQLCPTCQQRYETNPMRILDCKNEACNALIMDAPRILDALTSDARAHFDKVLALLDQNEVTYEIDHRLVRGLDYYTYTAYEFIGGSLGAQNALGGGGRYDLLAEEIGAKKQTCAVGFAAGIERLIMAMESENLFPELQAGVDVFIATFGGATQDAGFKLAHDLRKQNISTLTELMGRSLKAQMREANRSGARFALILGEDELRTRRASLKNLANSDQKEVDLNQIAEEIKSQLQSNQAR
ncbi:MAG: histidine--tRNA ligase [Calditrichaeota bacterium]|nr:MAG: histidine--tRNA ligase [Calditrichota bacterium]